MRRPATTLWLCGLVCACAAEPPVEPTLWSGTDVRPELSHPIFATHPALTDLSLYALRVEGPVSSRPDHQHRGVFGIGNGKMFATLGLTDPLNTLHGTVGPNYTRGPRFFGDIGVTLDVEPRCSSCADHESVARVRRTGIVVTALRKDGVDLYTIDFAPRPADEEVPAALVRIVGARARATRSSVGDAQVKLRLSRAQTSTVIDGTVFETIEGRALAHVGDITRDRDGYLIDFSTMKAGETRQSVLVLATGTTTTAALATGVAVHEAAERLLAETIADWHEFSERGLQLDLPDERVEDLYDGMRVAIRNQQSVAGAISPMSNYTRVWLRDSIGPVRFFMKAGLHQEARAAIDYLYNCHATTGDIVNSCSSGLLPEDFGVAPDWSQLGPLAERVSAEGPSYLPLVYAAYVEGTGDWQFVRDRWPYLERAIMAQTMDAEGRQTFSGDETFRTAMAAAMGLGLATEFGAEYWSSNSSFLMAAGSDWMAEASEQLDEPGADAYRARAALARSALERHFLDEAGSIVPFVERATGIAERRPYEDVTLKALWTGAYAPEDPLPQSSLSQLEVAAARGDGTVQSPLDEKYHNYLGLEVYEGIATGMVPGYYLHTLDLMGAPEATAAFNAIHRYADAAGQYGEYLVYDDLSSLSPVYDAFGSLGDRTAHYRPWEGGINLDAMLGYLVRTRPDGDDLVVRARLVNNWRSMRLTGVPILGTQDVLNLEVTRDGQQVQAVLTSDVPVRVIFEMPGTTSELPHTIVTAPLGETWVRSTPSRSKPEDPADSTFGSSNSSNEAVSTIGSGSSGRHA